jgi:glyoxylase I family protein
MAPNFSGVHHVALCVDDVDAATDFYVDVLGCEQRADRPDFGFPGAWLDAGTQQIHLMQFADSPRTASHFALRVEDLDAWCAHLDAHGVAYRRSDHVANAGFQAFLADPAGNQIELNQPDH